jgi:ectoine hydroxylase-related dioxygenase (phytanoyl-CoA dioxygenase family)
VNALTAAISEIDTDNPTFRKTKDLFAIRQFLKEVPGVSRLIFKDELRDLIYNIFSPGYFVVKSIYFDKPKLSNWFVAWHQDLTISVDKRKDIDGYGPWTVKQNQFAVQPPIDILEDNFTLRIHLDDTNADNGALKVISRSHLKNICRPEVIDWTIEKEQICAVKAGGLMLMRPLLLHGSNRTINNNRRRVIHIEFSRKELTANLNWSEKMNIDSL